MSLALKGSSGGQKEFKDTPQGGPARCRTAAFQQGPALKSSAIYMFFRSHPQRFICLKENPFSELYLFPISSSAIYMFFPIASSAIYMFFRFHPQRFICFILSDLNSTTEIPQMWTDNKGKYVVAEIPRFSKSPLTAPSLLGFYNVLGFASVCGGGFLELRNPPKTGIPQRRGKHTGNSFVAETQQSNLLYFRNAP